MTLAISQEIYFLVGCETLPVKYFWRFVVTNEYYSTLTVFDSLIFVGFQPLKG